MPVSESVANSWGFPITSEISEKKADHVINKAHGDKTKVMDQENFKYVG